jgi:N-methylhydantoinase A
MKESIPRSTVRVPKALRAAVDIGGTFTDLVVHDPNLGTIQTHKVLTTPDDPGRAMLQGIDELGVVTDIDFLVHGTTAGLNALLSRSGDRVALVTTDGFRDVALIGRGENSNIWSLRPHKPAPLVAREDIRSVRERVRFDGSIELALSEDDVRSLAQWLKDESIQSVAVCLLHAHTNPVHERRVKELLLRATADLSVVLSHEVAPEQGEFERTSTTVATGYVARRIDDYLRKLVLELKSRDCSAPLHVMRSSGGICSVEQVACQPIQTIFSGPAGGVVAAEALARTLTHPNLIAIDIGGTSSDVSLIVAGRRSFSREEKIGDQVVRMPVVEIHSIGAGGGSIARVEGGGLRVGPESAGARPGPACYGQGGEAPTVTDAQVVLRRIDPKWFLGGRMPLDVSAAERAVGQLAASVGLGLEEAAEGILAVANAKMANAIRTLGLRRGIDPRHFTLLAFGGAGPLHGTALAEELGIEEVLIPFATGVLSAWGMLHADIRHDLSAPFLTSASGASARQALFRIIAELRSKGEWLLAQEDVSVPQREYLVHADMRYVQQEHSIAVRICETEDFIETFHNTYLEQYGHNMPGAPVEFVNVRLAAIGRIGADCRSDHPQRARREESSRPIRIEGAWVEARVLHRDSMPPDVEIPGPAVILESSSTTLLPPDWRARQERDGNLFLRKNRP